MKIIPISLGLYTAVDDDIYNIIKEYFWQYQKSGPTKDYYAIRVIHLPGGRRKTVRMHRDILKITDPNVQIDHINGNTLDNQRINLRVCTNKDNTRNQSKRKSYKGRVCTSSFKGVSWDRNRNNWKAYIGVDYQYISLGRFNSEEEAARAYDSAALHYFGEFARLNNV